MKSIEATINESCIWVDGPLDTQCLIWKTTSPSNPYARIRREGETIRVSRLMYEKHNGPIPFAYCVLHKCDNPACINHEHLFAGRELDNVKDMIAKGRDPFKNFGFNTYSAKLTEQQVKEIRSLFGIQSQADIARKYKVSTSTISLIKLGRIWTHV